MCKSSQSGRPKQRQAQTFTAQLHALSRSIDRVLRSRGGGLALASAALALGGTAQAATINVTAGAVDNSVNGNCSLVEAVNAANTDTAVDACTAGSGADALVLPTNSTFTFADSNDGDNALPSVGSDITIQGDGATIERSAASNTPDFRLFHLAGAGDLTLADVTVANGNAVGAGGIGNSGGGILNDSGTLALTNSTVSGNSADFAGGGIFNDGTLTLSNSTVSGNSADVFGGGIVNIYGDLALTNSTVSGNSADNAGGGIYNGDGFLTLTNSTITANAAVDGYGSGVASYSRGPAEIRVEATIIAGNINSDVDRVFGFINPFISNGDNLIGDGNITGAFGESGDQTGVTDPMLDALADNGGPTPTHALQSNSPALDAVTGTCPPPATDQRGTTRPVDGNFDGSAVCDIGAFEFANIPVALSITPDPATLNEDGSNSATLSACLPGGVNAVQAVDVTLGITGTATPGTDHDLATPTQVTIANGDNCGAIDVAAIDDAVDEPDETVVADITAVDSSSDDFIEASPEQQVSATIADDDLAGITVTPTSGLATIEAGGTDSFTVALESQPTSSVTIPISSDDTTEGKVTPAALTFTPGNWNLAQAVIVTGQDDLIDDGDIAFNVVTAAASSSDPNYNGTDPADVGVTNTDDDMAGISVNPTSGLTTDEGGGVDAFTVVIDSQPTGNVTIPVSSDDTTEGTPSPAAVTFTPGNWNLAQAVIVTGQDDLIDDGDIAFNIVTGPVNSSDPNYNSTDPADVGVNNVDDDDQTVDEVFDDRFESP